MKVECPHCNTVFKIDEAQLEIADGMVRCGVCQDVFNALHNIDDPFSDDDDAGANTAATATSTPAAPPPLEKAIENLAATLDKKADKLAEEPAKELAQAFSNLASQAAEVDTSKEKSTSANKSEEHSELFENVQSKLIPDEYRIPELSTPYSIWKDIAWSLAILMLTVSLFVEYAWFNRHELAAKPELKPFVTKVCNFTACEDMDLRYPKEIEMVSRNIYSHPNVKSALMVSLTMVNHAMFAQPFPKVKINFSNVRGEVIASRVFLPEEYLQLEHNSLRLLPIESSTDISMEIQDPGPQAMTYEFSFL